VPFRVGQLVWATIRGINKTADRPCVIVGAPSPAHLEVVYGQGKAYLGCPCPVAVLPTSLLGHRLGLSKETHFCGWQVISISAVQHVCMDPPHGRASMCPITRLPAIEQVAVEARKRLARSRRP
jgi:hypothetical protein